MTYKLYQGSAYFIKIESEHFSPYQPHFETFAWTLQSIKWLNSMRCPNACIQFLSSPRTRAWVYAHACTQSRLSATPWTVACPAPLSTEFSRQEYWSGLPFPSPGDLPKPGMEPTSLASPALAEGFSSSPPATS